MNRIQSGLRLPDPPSRQIAGRNVQCDVAGSSKGSFEDLITFRQYPAPLEQSSDRGDTRLKSGSSAEQFQSIPLGAGPALLAGKLMPPSLANLSGMGSIRPKLEPGRVGGSRVTRPSGDPIVGQRPCASLPAAHRLGKVGL